MVTRGHSGPIGLTMADPRQAALDRQRSVAQALLAMSQQPLQQPNVRGAMISPLEGINKLAQSLLGAYQDQKLDKQQMGLDQQLGQENLASSQRLVSALMAQGTDPAKAQTIAEILAGGGPGGEAALQSILPPPTPAGFTLSPGQTRFGGNGEQVANIPAPPPTPAAPPAGFTLGPGQSRFDAQGNPIANLPANEPAPRAPSSSVLTKIGPDGKPGIFRQNPETGAFDIYEGAPVEKPAATGNAASDRRVDNLRTKFSGEPIVKKYNTVTDALQFVKTVPMENNNPAYDQALIYAFAKAMDPDSVVREGEYATVQKYAQSWLDNFKFNAKRVIDNGEFLTPEARKNMKAVIEQRSKPVVSQYGNLRKSYANQVNAITGSNDGESYLIDYGSAFEEPPTPVPGVPAVGGTFNGSKVLKVEKVK